MTLLVGCPVEDSSTGAVRLAVMLARPGENLVVVAVLSNPWTPGMARVDSEYQSFLDARADDALEQARSELTGDVSATFVRRHARSVSAGLLEVAEHHDARLIVLGSSTSGMLGRVALGGVGERLLHSSPRLVALAPRGFRCTAARVTRVTAAYGGGDQSEHLVLAAAAQAEQIGAALRLASFAVRPRSTILAGIGSRGEDGVVQEWMHEIANRARETVAVVAQLPQPPRIDPSQIGRGITWEDAMNDVEWIDGDVLVVGSSNHGPLAQVFLGARASKIIRHCPVPVVVVPRGQATAGRNVV
ncbi:universal stress protein [Dermatophilaceae bacterium Sec6.4]